MKIFKLLVMEIMFYAGVGLVGFGLWLINPIAAFIGIGLYLMFHSAVIYNHLKNKKG